MVNLYSPAAVHASDFAISSHSSFTSSARSLSVIEPLSDDARRFLASFGFHSGAVTVTGRDLRELRFAARDAGLSL
jgi:hypothetical protein